MDDAAIVMKRAENQQKLLFEIIKRYDGYIASANAKVAVILSYAMAYIGGVVFKVIDLSAKRTHDVMWWVSLILAALSIAATFYAASRAYAALNPQTPPGRAQYEQPSVVFFGDVATLEGGRDGYVGRINAISDNEVIDDLARQAFILANIVFSKMKSIKDSIAILVRMQLPLSVATILLLCLTLP